MTKKIYRALCSSG